MHIDIFKNEIYYHFLHSSLSLIRKLFSWGDHFVIRDLNEVVVSAPLNMGNNKNEGENVCGAN